MLTEKKINVNKHLLFNEITYIYTVNNQQKGIKNEKDYHSDHFYS